MGNDEDEELLDAEIPRVRMNPRTPTNRQRNKNMRIQDLLFAGTGVRLVLKVEVVDNIESVRIANDSPLLSWLPRFAAQVMNKMRSGKDGKTSEMR